MKINKFIISIFFSILFVFLFLMVIDQKIVEKGLKNSNIKVYNFINDIPDKYPNLSYSVKGLLSNKKQYLNNSNRIRIKGIVGYKYECSFCDQEDGCELCVKNYIFLNDFIKNNSPQNEIVVVFEDGDEIFNNIKIGDSVEFGVIYDNSLNIKFENKISAENWYFLYTK